MKDFLRIHAQVQRDLMRGGRAGGDDGSAEPDLRRAVHVPAHDALDMRMPPHHRLHRIRILEAHRIEMREAGAEWGWCIMTTVGASGRSAKVPSSQAIVRRRRGRQPSR